MDPQINIPAGPAAVPSTTGSTDTFTEQVAAESTVTPDAFAQNQVATNQHNRRIIYYLVWGGLVLLLLSLIGIGSYVLWRNRQGIASGLGINSLFDRADVSLPNNQELTLGGGSGLLTINGNEQVNGDLTVTGTVQAGNFVGNGSGLTGVVATAAPFTAFTNKSDQVFFGSNQVFKNAIDSATGFQIQSAGGNPLFVANTAANEIGINTGSPGKNLDVNGTARVNQTLEVGNAALSNSTILTSLYFGSNISKTLSIGEHLQTAAPATAYVASGTEMLIDPSTDPFANGNIFAASYSAAQTAQSSPWNYSLVGGTLNNLTHAGSGNVAAAIGQLGVVSNIGTGSISNAIGGAYTTFLSGSGSIGNAVSLGTLNPVISGGATGTITSNIGLWASNFGASNQANILSNVGLLVSDQNASASVNVNVASLGSNSLNYFEGNLAVGLSSASLSGYAALKAATNLKLVVSTDVTGANATLDPLATTQLNNGGGTTKALVVQNTIGGTGDLTEWQSSTGSILARVTSTGAVGIGQAPTNKFDVTDTSDNSPASFTGTSGTCTVDTFGGGWSCVSDAKLKTNIMAINGGLDKVLQLQGVTYNWKNDPQATQVVSGFIAQEVQKVLPGLVTTLQDGTLSLNKDGMLPYLVEAVKTEHGQIDDVNQKLLDQGIKVDTISTDLKALADKVTDLQTQVDSLVTKTAAQELRIEELEKKLNTQPSTTTTATP